MSEITNKDIELTIEALKKLELDEAEALFKMICFTISSGDEDDKAHVIASLKERCKDEVVFEEEMGETLYFNVPTTWLTHEYPEAVHATVAINSDGTYPRISPTREVEGGSEDYDWIDFYPTFDQIRKIQDAIPRK